VSTRGHHNGRNFGQSCSRILFEMVASKSNDPAALMQTVGTVSGVVSAVGFMLATFGALRKTAA
jgi:hypothetical protein